MERWTLSARRTIGVFWRHQVGATAVVVAIMLSSLMGFVGLAVDVGQAMAAKISLSTETQAAALAGAQALLANNANTTTVTAAVNAWTTANPPANVTSASATTSLSCVTATSNLPTCTNTSPNAVAVTQTAQVSTHFLKAFGYPSFTLTSTATAAKAGGAGTPLNVMFILDATGSMGSADSKCTVPNVKNPTRFQCAEYSIQSILQVMQPSMSSVGLMVFPGMGSQYTPGSKCGTQPASVPYLSSKIYYQIGTGLATDYHNAAGALNDTSTIVEAVGDAGTKLSGCLGNKGGEGTYLAEVLTKAQAVLPVVTGTKNVIILLSDGDANASQSALSGQKTMVSKQCGQYVTAAQTATTAGTTVYAVAYGAATSGCSSGDTYNPCTAMKAVASDSSKFFSTDTTCAPSVSGNSLTNLPSIFTQIAVNLTKPRLL